VVGCATALRLRQKGLSVLVLEKSVPGAEASSAAAGMLSAQSHADEDTPALSFALRSAALHASLATELRDVSGIDVGWKRSGAIAVAFSDEDAGRLARRVDWQRARDLRAEWLDAPMLREREPAVSDAAAGAAYFPEEAQVDAPLFARALSAAALHAGARFASSDPVRRIVSRDGRVVGVETQAVTHATERVVVAAGAWSSLVTGSGLAPGTVRPARGQIVALTPKQSLFGAVLWSSDGYVVPKGDGRVLAGSTIEDVGFQKAVTAEGMARILSAALALVPGLADAEIAASWSGFRPVTDDRLPLVGPTRTEGLFLATGHFTDGILLAPATAEAIAALVVGERPPIDVSAMSPRRLG
jgi:glycine oxidase